MRKIMAIKFKDILSIFVLLSILIIMVFTSGRLTNHIIEVVSQKRLLPIYSVETTDKKVALTFDCAWGANDIDEIINALGRKNVSATFFTVGTWVDKYSTEVKKLSDSGHEIGNHSNNHAHVNNLSYDANLSDMKKCNEKIEKITGKKVKFYRGPYGEYNNVVISTAEELGMKVIQWDVDTLDYMGKTPDEMCARITKKIRNGSIILMHNDTEYTSKGLEQIIECIQNKGYDIVPLSELIYEGDYYIDHEGRQIKK